METPVWRLCVKFVVPLHVCRCGQQLQPGWLLCQLPRYSRCVGDFVALSDHAPLFVTCCCVGCAGGTCCCPWLTPGMTAASMMSQQRLWPRSAGRWRLPRQGGGCRGLAAKPYNNCGRYMASFCSDVLSSTLDTKNNLACQTPCSSRQSGTRQLTAAQLLSTDCCVLHVCNT